MICPKCKSEYIDGIYTCSDCNTSLVDHLPTQDQPVDIHLDKENFVSVYHPINSQEVAIIKMILEREGIPFYVKNDRLHGAVLFAIQGPGKMELFVPDKYAQSVLDLINHELGHE